MRLFQENKPNRKPLIITLLMLTLVISVCVIIFSNTAKSTTREKQQITQNAIERAIVNCYAIEGFYPDNIEYLEENYGILIDHKKYVVLYETVGANVHPYVQVVQRGSVM